MHAFYMAHSLVPHEIQNGFLYKIGKSENAVCLNWHSASGSVPSGAVSGVNVSIDEIEVDLFSIGKNARFGSSKHVRPRSSKANN